MFIGSAWLAAGLCWPECFEAAAVILLARVRSCSRNISNTNLGLHMMCMVDPSAPHAMQPRRTWHARTGFACSMTVQPDHDAALRLAPYNSCVQAREL